MGDKNATRTEDDNEKLELSDVALELNLPRIKSYQSNLTRVSIVKLESKIMKAAPCFSKFSSAKRMSKRRFKTPEPKDLLNTVNPINAYRLHKQHEISASERAINNQNIENTESPEEESYHDEDSQVMSEHKHKGITAGNTTDDDNRFTLSEKRIPKLCIY